MKRFSKILTLILALVTILTAFTVVALADVEGGQAKTQSITDYEDQTDGTTKSTTFFYKEDYPDGNTYLVFDATNGGGKNFSVSGGVSSNSSNHRVKDWPIIAYDFDFMTPTGTLGYRDKDGNSAGFRPRPYYRGVNGTSAHKQSSYWDRITFKAMGLSTEKYLWQHVTLIYVWEGFNYTYNDVTSSNFYSTYVSINGAEPKHISTKDLTSLFSSYGNTGYEDQTVLGVIYFYNSNYGVEGNNYLDCSGYQCVDNFTASYFSKEYKSNLTEVSNYIYKNGAYTMPESYKGTIATVTYTDGEGNEAIKYFDDVAKALKFAQDNNGEFSLAGNISASYDVDAKITLDARKRDSEGNLTGEVYTGVIEYATTNVGYYMVETETPGVYESVMGDFMLTTSTGVGTAYTADKLVEKLRSPGSGSIIKLLSDVEIDPSLRLKTSGSSAGSAEEGAISVTTNFTLDLNGHELRRVYYYGSEYVADENGVYPEEATAVAAKNGALFDMENKAAVLNITSTAGTNGKIYNVGVKCNTYVKNGEIEKREITAFGHNLLIYSITGGAKIYISNTDIYTGKILGAVWGNNFVTVRMNNSNFYQMSKGTAASVASNGEWIFHFRGDVGYDIQVENSLFYLNAPVDNSYTYDGGQTAYGTVGLFRSNEATPDGKTVISIFKNCDIISAEGKHTAGIFNENPNETLVFEDCRFYNNDIQDNFVASKGTLSNYGYSDPVNRKYHTYPPIPAAGWSTKNISISLDYTVPAVDGWTATEGDVQSVDFSFGTKTQTCKFNKITTKEVDVTVGENTVKLIPGVSTVYDNKALRIYADTESDMLLNTIYLLKDAEGNVIDSILGIYDGKFSFDWENACVLTASEETAFVGGIKADFNLNFLTGFRYNLYIPVDARLTDVAVEGYAKSETTVLIDSEEYTVWYKTVGTAAAAEANTISATFKVDGEEYSQTWSINAIAYAGLLLDQSSDLYPNEAAAIGAMAKFIKEAVALTDGSTADVAAIDAIITKSGVATTYGDYTEGKVDALNGLNGAVTGAQYLVYNGVAAYKFTVAAEDTEISFTVNGENVDFTRGSETDGETTVYYVILEPMRVYDLIDTLTITSGEDSVDFTMVDYLTKLNDAENINLAKALYEFGLAADEYKKDIMKAAK